MKRKILAIISMILLSAVLLISCSETVSVVGASINEKGELILMDYKTDRVSTAGELVERYAAQLDTYAIALEELYGIKPSEKIIYSLHLSQEIAL